MRPSQVAPYPSAGEVIDGKYQILQMLGEGGMGAVAKAHHVLRRAPVALKFMAPHVLTIPGAVERFLNEAVAASQIENQHVVTIYDVGKLPTGAPYLVMEYLEGRDLSHLIETEGQRGIDVPRAVHFTLQVLRALQVAHAAGIIHRDLKPSNAFIIKKDGERDFVKLVDFGISKVQQPGAASLTQTNSALGTPLYMSPEQAKSPRDVDLRSDLYSVGCILYELLTGRTPHFSESGELTEILFKLFTQDPTPISQLRPDLPAGLPEVVHHGLAREPTDRFSTTTEFAEALAPYADDRSRSVIERIRAGVDQRKSEPVPHGSLPAPMPSQLQAFSQLNSMQFPQPTPVSIIPTHGALAQTPAEMRGRTQAIPQESIPPTRQSPGVAVAGTQASGAAAKTDMGSVSDTKPPAAAPSAQPGVSPGLIIGGMVAMLLVGAVLVVGGVVGGAKLLGGNPPSTANTGTKVTGDVPPTNSALVTPPVDTMKNVVVTPPPSAIASTSASVVTPTKSPPTGTQGSTNANTNANGVKGSTKVNLQ